MNARCRRRSIARSSANNDDKVDRRNIGHMDIPGIFILESLFAPAGSGAEKGNSTARSEYRNCQFMTPETRAHDAFLLELPEQLRGRRPDIAVSLHQSLIEGFLEDKASSRASSTCSTRTRRSRCIRSSPMRRSRISGARSAS